MTKLALLSSIDSGTGTTLTRLTTDSRELHKVLTVVFLFGEEAVLISIWKIIDKILVTISNV